MLKICVNSGLCPLSSPKPLKLPGVLAAIPVSGCHQAGPGPALTATHRNFTTVPNSGPARPDTPACPAC